MVCVCSISEDYGESEGLSSDKGAAACLSAVPLGARLPLNTATLKTWEY